jgi:hypothetical protein
MRGRANGSSLRSFTPKAMPASSSHLPSGIRPAPASLAAPTRLLTPTGIVELQPPDEFVVGRDSSCALVLDDPLVSRLHATIVLRTDGAHLVDSSTNGVYVNDVRVDKASRLYAGDRILIGTTELSVF